MQHYDTVALRNYWGFKWLDRTGLNSFWLALGLFAFSLGLVYAAELVLAAYSDDGPNTLPPELKFVVASFLSVFVTAWVSLARGAQLDFLAMDEAGLIAPNLELTQLMETRKRVRLMELIGGSMLGVGMYNLGRATVNNLSQTQAFFETLREMRVWYIAPTNVLGWIIFAIIGVSIVRLSTFLWRQVAVWENIAARLDIDILRTEILAVFANQPLRTLIGTIVMVSGLLALGNIEGGLGQTYYNIGIPLQILQLIVTILVSRPLWKVRQRVRAEKKSELNKIQLAIAGDPDALLGSRIEKHRKDFSLPDMLYYEDKISAVWE